MTIKKKVICLVIDTELTNEEIESRALCLTFVGVEGNPDPVIEPCRNVRVLDSDEIKEREDD